MTAPEITFLLGTFSDGGADSCMLFPGSNSTNNVFGATLFTAESTAVPLPASGLLLLGGIAALGAARRRRAA